MAVLSVAEILAGKIPLGRVLINHDVLRQIDLGAILKISPGTQIQEYFRCGPTDTKRSYERSARRSVMRAVFGSTM